jgi:threonine dehydrogenase-like Zn-dependent dehydrogenase
LVRAALAAASPRRCRVVLLLRELQPQRRDRGKDVRSPVAGIFGYSHLTGGFAGGQAQYARVPFADVGPLKIESDLTDEQVLFLSDILPTGYMGAEMCDIQPSDVVAVWGRRLGRPVRHG